MLPRKNEQTLTVVNTKLRLRVLSSQFPGHKLRKCLTANDLTPKRSKISVTTKSNLNLLESKEEFPKTLVFGNTKL